MVSGPYLHSICPSILKIIHCVSYFVLLYCFFLSAVQHHSVCGCTCIPMSFCESMIASIYDPFLPLLRTVSLPHPPSLPHKRYPTHTLSHTLPHSRTPPSPHTHPIFLQLNLMDILLVSQKATTTGGDTASQPISLGYPTSKYSGYHTHTYMHTYMHTFIHTSTHTHRITYTYAHSHLSSHTHTL